MISSFKRALRRKRARPRWVPASQEMRSSFGLERMAAPGDVDAWFEGLFQRVPFDRQAVAYFRGLRREMGTTDEPLGGGFWFGDRRLVMLRGAQDEAAIHELAHAWWERRRTQQRDALMDLLRSFGRDPPAGFPTIADLAGVYCNGIPTQVDPSSPTGYWGGMLAEDNDHETFAGFCSGVRAHAEQMPPDLRAFYRGLLRGA
jgi:hypothetical protein